MSLIHYVQRWQGLHLTVVGDLMLDVYEDAFYRDAEQQVLTVQQRTYHPGGAGHAAWLADAVGAQVHLAGVVGDDPEGGILYRELHFCSRLASAGIFMDPTRPTTTKTRTTVDGLPFCRRDHEHREALLGRAADNVIGFLRARHHTSKAVLLSDYGKGVLAGAIGDQTVLDAARGVTEDGPVVLDPKRIAWPCDYMTPNEAELTAMGRMRRLRPQGFKGHAIETRGQAGARVHTGLGYYEVPTVPAIEVDEAVGAGDAFAVGFTLAKAAGASVKEATQIGHALARWRVTTERSVRPSVQAITNQIELLENFPHA